MMTLLWTVFACSRTPSGACEPPGTQLERVRAAGCVTVVDGRLLLVQRRSERWSIPGGYVEKGEDAATGAVRETFEEAGVRVRADAPLCAVPSTAFVAYRCTALQESVPAPDGTEIRQARYFTRQAIADLPDEALRFPEQRADYLRWAAP